MRYIGVLIIIVQFNFLSAQPQNALPLIDSLKKVAASTKPTDTSMYRVVFKIAYELFDVDNREAVLYADQAYQLALRSGDSLQIIRSGRLFGQLLRRTDRLSDAISQFTTVLSIAERNGFVEEEKRILNALALAYNFQAVYDKALYYNFKSLKIRQLENDKGEIGNALNNIGLVYYKMSDQKHALEYYHAAFSIKQQINDKEGIDQILINLALCHISLEEYDKGIQFVYKAFQECGSKCNDQIVIQGEFSLGKSLSGLKKNQEAVLHLNKSYFIARRIGDKRQMMENSFILSRILVEQNKYMEAITKLSEAELLSKEAGYNQTLMSTYLLFSEIYSKQNNFEKASSYQSKYIRLKDKVYSDDLMQNLTKIQGDHFEEENLKRIQALRDNVALKEKSIRQQKLVNVVLSFAAGLLIIIGILIYRLYAMKRKSNKQLDQKVRQRTQQLEEGQTHLQGVLYEQKLFMENMRDEMRALMATLKGAAFDQQQVIYHSAVAKLNLLIERIDQKGTTSTSNKIALGFAFVFFLHISVFSQKINQVRFDSIKAHLPGKTIKDRQFLMHAMAYELFDVDNPTAKLYADTAWFLAKQLADSFKITKTGRLRGQLLRRTERLNEAIAQFQQVLPIAQRHHFLQEENFALNGLGVAYKSKGVYDSALDLGFRSLQMWEEEGDKLKVAMALNNIGAVYYMIHDYEHAILFYQKAKEVQDEIHEMQGMEIILINLSFCYIHLKEFEKANELTNEAFSFCKGECSDEIFIFIEQCRGRYSFHLKKYKEAVVHINRSNARAKSTGDIRIQTENLLTLGQIAAAQGNYDRAKGRFEEAVYLSKRFDYNQALSRVYFEFSRLYNKTGDFKKAAYFQNRYINLNDSIYDGRMIRNLAQVQIAYAERENLKLIKAQNENLALKEEAIHRQKFLNFTLLAVTCLITIIGILIYRLYALRSKTNRQLDDKVRQRTFQLEEGHAHLRGVLQEQRLFIENIREEMWALAATLKGLSLIGTQHMTLEKESETMTVAGATNKLDTLISRIDGKRDLAQGLGVIFK